MRLQFASYGPPVALAIASLFVCSAALAEVKGDRPAPEEQAMLPDWCIIPGDIMGIAMETIKSKYSPLIAAQIAQFHRTDCAGVHHYCRALLYRNRAFFDDITEPEALHYHAVSINNFEFVFKASKPTCSLVPDMYVKTAESYAIAKKYQEAKGSYEKALAARKGYAPAYIGLSDLYESMDQTDKSIAVLQQAIKENPKSSALKKKLARVESRTSAASANP